MSPARSTDDRHRRGIWCGVPHAFDRGLAFQRHLSRQIHQTEPSHGSPPSEFQGASRVRQPPRRRGPSSCRRKSPARPFSHFARPLRFSRREVGPEAQARRAPMSDVLNTNFWCPSCWDQWAAADQFIPSWVVLYEEAQLGGKKDIVFDGSKCPRTQIVYPLLC